MAEPRRLPGKRRRGRLGDLLLGACGIALGIGCAWFPWYVFLHPEEFGIRGGRFTKVDAALPTSRGGSAAPLFPDFIDSAKNPNRLLDELATGTTPDASEEAKPRPSAEDQPFPGPSPDFRLVMVANGQAMIEDGASFWIVQPGSILPDNSTVSAIEERDGQWVLVTSKERVVRVGQ